MSTLRYIDTTISIAEVAPRPGNRAPRRVDELAAAISTDGLLNRILVRRDAVTGVYELIAGERRVAAHKLLELKEIDARVYQCTDADAARLAKIDNLQREDLTPLEEGEGYVELLDQRHVPDVAELARQVGRSEPHVRQRMKLATLLPAIKKLLAEGKLDIGAALAIAQTPDAVQKKLAPRLAQHLEPRQRYIGGRWQKEDAGPPRITREAVRELLDEHTHALAGAPFDITDAALDSKAGPCGTCPKRSGAQGVLVEVIDRTDTCLDVACWDRKVAAHVKASAAEDKAKGLRVLSDAEARKIVDGGRTLHKSGYKAITESIYDGNTNVPVAKLIDEAVPRVVAYDEEGRRLELVPEKAVDAALKERTKSKGKAKDATANSHAAQERKKRQKVAVLKRSRDLALRQVGAMVSGGRISVETVLRVAISRTGITEADAVCRARGLDTKRDAVAALEEAAAGIVDDQKTVELRVRHLAAIVAELAVANTISIGGYSTDSQQTPAGLKAFDVDLAACRRAAKAELDAEADEKGSKAKAKGKAKKPAAAKAAPKAKAKPSKAAKAKGKR